ncbi:NosL [mine drainage metagenome]|uniref:NosL n=1 Tax=mine drainage metagenome TaxID=410659 RepID=A0A1J5QAQ6_9ZZZZ
MKQHSLFKHRQFLLLATVLLFGCGQQAATTLAPQEITRATTCSLDGMTLADYPGPKAQIFYAGQAKPEYFCDLLELFNVLLKPEQIRKVAAAYVQDMAQTDWDHPQGHWIAARTAWYVAGSRKTGSMGPTLGSFFTEKDAKAFAAANGGRVLKFGDITPAMADLSGSENHAGAM